MDNASSSTRTSAAAISAQLGAHGCGRNSRRSSSSSSSGAGVAATAGSGNGSSMAAANTAAAALRRGRRSRQVRPATSNAKRAVNTPSATTAKKRSTAMAHGGRMTKRMS